MHSALRLFTRSIQRWPWQLLAVAWLVTLAFNCWAWSVQYASMNEAHPASDVLYNSLGLFTFNSSASASPLVWQLDVARFLAPIVAMLTAVKTLGLLLTSEAFRLRQRFATGHVVVCGLGQRGFRLAMELHGAGNRVVVVERDPANPRVQTCHEAEISTITADATESHVLRLARVDSARHVIAVCGEDATNAEIAAQTAVLAGARRGTPVHCLTHIVDSQLWKLLRERELGDDPTSPFRLEFFNIFESGARALLREFPPFRADERSPHVLVVGLGRLGEHLTRRVAWEWYRRRRDGLPRMKLSVVDLAAHEHCTALTERCPQLAEACDLVPLEMDVCSPAFEQCRFLSEQQSDCSVTVVYVCLEDDTRALSAGLTLHRFTRGCEVPIVVRLDSGRGLADVLGGETVAAAEFADIRAFSFLDTTCRADLVLSGTHETLARATHRLYVDEQVAAGHGPEDNPLLVPWDDLPGEIKESNRRAADHTRVMLAAAGYSLAPLDDWDADLYRFSVEETETMGALEHERWMAERRAAGWRYAAGPRDVAAKTSPYMVAWDQLPEDVKDYDRVTVRKVPTLLADVGLQVRRVHDKVPA